MSVLLGTASLSLSDLNLRHHYCTDSPGETLRERHQLEDFYIPCLKRSLTIVRLVSFLVAR
ncbi:MAG: hypothetical protein KME27_29545 [Lyngbya sp. HA4199-MV5]|jgi:hypothetical protein|nr:hypothetical protein [Lyngbya sp. HA4199-MV5]